MNYRTTEFVTEVSTELNAELTNETTNRVTSFLIACKAAFVGVGSGFTIAFGWLGWLIVAWVACMMLDWVTGSVAACKEGKWSSATAREGIFHKAGMMVVVITAAIADGVLGMLLTVLPNFDIVYPAAILPVVLVWYIFTELGSIAENATTMGAQVPSFLSKMLAVGQNLTEENLFQK